MLKSIADLQQDYFDNKTNGHKKKLGQFFTGVEAASFMASLVTIPDRKKIRILDAGAGVGILTAASVLRCVELGCKEIHAVLYELDEQIGPYLDKSMKLVSKISKGRAKFTYEVIHKDFVLSRPDKDADTKPFDVSVINPPYFKYNVKTSPYAEATVDLYKGNPNIYASFMAVAFSCLKKNGEMVVIAPRSFTNGLYFKGFRNYLCDAASLEHVHVFVTRDRVFKESKVLQENVICKYLAKSQSSRITITASQASADINEPTKNTYPKELIIDSSNGERIIRIPENKRKADILRRAQKLESTFTDAGYFISTGPVVDFRTRNYISEDPKMDNAVPLVRTHNVTPLEALWSGEHWKDRRFKLIENYEKHLIPNKTYVLLKRFSSKDERRRLVAAVYNPNNVECELVGFDNKINYLGVKNGKLTLTEAYGLSAVFNSTFIDNYFRCLSGNTQVNATEIRVLRFPSRNSVKAIGRKVKDRKQVNQEAIDEIVTSVLRVKH